MTSRPSRLKEMTLEYERLTRSLPLMDDAGERIAVLEELRALIDEFDRILALNSIRLD